jgi:hypothetical protein
MKNVFQKAQSRQFFIGSSIIVIGVILVWLPYILFMPITGLHIDSPQYYSVLSGIEQHINHTIGYPQIGYPVFLKICELILNKLWFVVLMQISLNVFAVLFFYYAYFKTFGKYLIPVSLLLLGYLSSDLNLNWDSSIMPDSLLAFFNTLCLGLVLYIVGLKKYKLIPLLSFVIVCAISVRPSALILIPLFILLMIYLFFQNNNKLLILINCLIFTSFLLGLSTVNYITPGYRTFGIITFPPNLNIENNRSSVDKKMKDDTLLKDLSVIAPNEHLDAILAFQEEPGVDSSYYLYMKYLKRGMSIRLDKDSNLLFKVSEGGDIKLDSIAKDKQGFIKFKNHFINRYKDTMVSYSVNIENRLRWVHFVYFFKYFYIDGSKHYDIENKDFYSTWLKYRWDIYYVRNIWQTRLHDYFWLVSKNVVPRTSKEQTFTTPKTVADLNFVDNKMSNSFIYRYFTKPYYSIHSILFRNILYPIVFVIVFILSCLGLLLSKFRSSLFLISFSACSLLLMTDILHSFQMTFLTLRYTYQVTFMYYVTMIMFPLIIQSFWHYKKHGVFKY